MKKLVKGGIIAFASFCFLIGFAKAESIYYTNEVGVEMTELEYNKMLKIYSARYLTHMTQELFDSLKDANIIANDSTYYKTSYQNGLVVSEEHITKEEFDSASYGYTSNGIAPLDGDYDYVETSYKRLSGSVVELSSGKYQLMGALSWKKVPVTRSYDVFAYRLNHLTYSGFNGDQTYYFSGGGRNNVTYNTSSPGYKYFDNGAGVSMNLVDGSTISGYELTIVTTLTKDAPSNITQGHVYLSYQHAQSDLTRAQSMDYYLSNLGHGNVIYFNNSTTASKYDAMGGVHMVPTF